MAELTHLTTEFSTISTSNSGMASKNIVPIFGDPMKNPALFKDVEALLEKGETITNNIYIQNGEKINLYLLMNDLLEDDPWMSEPWTNEEEATISLAEVSLDAEEF